MKIYSTLTILALTASSFAQKALDGMKSDPIAQPTTGGASPYPLVQMLILAGVMFVLLKYVLPKFIKSNGAMRKNIDSSIKVEECATIGQGGLYVVTVRGRTLFVGASQNGMTCLADLTENEKQFQAEPAFFELVDQALVNPQPQAPTQAAIENENQSAADRLRQLLGESDAA